MYIFPILNWCSLSSINNSVSEVLKNLLCTCHDALSQTWCEHHTLIDLSFFFLMNKTGHPLTTDSNYTFRLTADSKSNLFTWALFINICDICVWKSYCFWSYICKNIESSKGLTNFHASPVPGSTKISSSWNNPDCLKRQSTWCMQTFYPLESWLETDLFKL